MLRWTNPPIRLFHGTLSQHVSSILSGIDLNKCNPKSDFGRGFYLTTSFDQADDWSDKMALTYRRTAAVMQFDVHRDQLAKLDILLFVRHDEKADDFWQFVEHCRTTIIPNHGRIEDAGWYDLVAGPVSQSYNRRLAHSEYDQFSLHTDLALTILRNAKQVK
ncbi:MAG: DUF3990 domain-containing protein [Candidatus Poribacteria bacterium]|nr:DUF3990 domain-containing protein [Candidatus Poribacteria bacterium]